jgi:hypothetical protein
MVVTGTDPFPPKPTTCIVSFDPYSDPVRVVLLPHLWMGNRSGELNDLQLRVVCFIKIRDGFTSAGHPGY